MFDGNITGEYIEFVSNLTVKASRELTLVSINIALLINDVFTLNFFVSLQKTENFINLDTEQIKNVTYTNDKGVPWFHSNCANAYDFRTSIIPPNSWSRTFSFLPPTSLVSALPNVSCLTLNISFLLVTSVVTLLSLMLTVLDILTLWTMVLT